MNGHNAQFVANPLKYVEARAVNNLTWFRRAILPANGATLGALNNALGVAKTGAFDLQALSIDTVELKVMPAGPIQGDNAIQAYWCPFIQGGGLPGWVDIPKNAPPMKFVFTAAMNGCRLVITNRSATHFRVYHHQHPDSGGPLANGIWQAIHAQGHEVVSHMGYDEYGVGEDFGRAPNAFNFLYYRNGGWNYVSQPQYFDMATLKVTKLPLRTFMRSIMG
jgi:hypothetical protein